MPAAAGGIPPESVMSKLELKKTRQGDYILFVCDMDMPEGRDSCDGQIVDVAKWLQKQKLRPGEYAFKASRTDAVVKEEILSVVDGAVVATGGTKFKPWRLRLEVKVPMSVAMMFAMGFGTTEA